MNLFTDVVREALRADSLSSRVNAVDAVAIILLIVLLVEREVLRAHAIDFPNRRLPGTASMITPLVVLCAIFVTARMLNLLT
jgi:hypothetical protein